MLTCFTQASSASSEEPDVLVPATHVAALLYSNVLIAALRFPVVGLIKRGCISEDVRLRQLLAFMVG